MPRAVMHQFEIGERLVFTWTGDVVTVLDISILLPSMKPIYRVGGKFGSDSTEKYWVSEHMVCPLKKRNRQMPKGAMH